MTPEMQDELLRHVLAGTIKADDISPSVFTTAKALAGFNGLRQFGNLRTLVATTDEVLSHLHRLAVEETTLPADEVADELRRLHAWQPGRIVHLNIVTEADLVRALNRELGKDA